MNNNLPLLHSNIERHSGARAAEYKRFRRWLRKQRPTRGVKTEDVASPNR